MEFPTMEALSSMADRERPRLLRLLSEIANDEATRIRQSQEALVKAGLNSTWDAGRAEVHDALCAVAELFDQWLRDANKAVADGSAPARWLTEAAEIVRNYLIVATSARQRPARGQKEETSDAV